MALPYKTDIYVNEMALSLLNIGIDPGGKDKSAMALFSRKKKPQPLPIYKGYAGLEVVSYFLRSRNWSDKEGVLVFSEDNYFLGLLYGSWFNNEIVIVTKDSDGGPWELKLDIKKINLWNNYYNAILVQGLTVVDKLTNFMFCSIADIEAGAAAFQQSEEWYSMKMRDEQSALSDISLDGLTYQRLVKAANQPNIPEGATWKDIKTGEVKKWNGKEWILLDKLVDKRQREANKERQLIF